MSMIVNRRDLDFLMYETLKLEHLLQHPRYSDYDRESVDAILDLSQQLAEDVFLPFASVIWLRRLLRSIRERNTSNIRCVLL